MLGFSWLFQRYVIIPQLFISWIAMWYIDGVRLYSIKSKYVLCYLLWQRLFSSVGSKENIVYLINFHGKELSRIWVGRICGMLLSGNCIPFELMLGFIDTGRNKIIRLRFQNNQCRIYNISQGLIYRDEISILSNIDWFILQVPKWDFYI